MKRTTALALSLSLAGGTLVAQEGSVRSLLSKDLAGDSRREVSLIMFADGEDLAALVGDALPLDGGQVFRPSRFREIANATPEIQLERRYGFDR